MRGARPPHASTPPPRLVPVRIVAPPFSSLAPPRHPLAVWGLSSPAFNPSHCSVLLCFDMLTPQG